MLLEHRNAELLAECQRDRAAALCAPPLAPSSSTRESECGARGSGPIGRVLRNWLSDAGDAEPAMTITPKGVSNVEYDAFDTLTRTAAGARSRRGMLRLLAGGALVSLLGTNHLGGDADAKSKRKKKPHAPRGCGGAYPVRCSPTADDPRAICFPAGAICCGGALGGGACPPGQSCCPPSVIEPAGTCAGPDQHCCPADAGGGSCPLTSPTCCPPTDDSPAGFCSPSNVTCCNFGNIYCDADEDCCPPSFALPDGGCVRRGTPCPSGDDWSDERHARRSTAGHAEARVEERRLAVRGQHVQHRHK
jgi:hypothetical protein